MSINHKLTTTAATEDLAEAGRAGALGYELVTETVIDAPVATVWAILIDLDRYAEWNPFVTSAAGVIEEGSKLSISIQPVGRGVSSFSPTVTTVVPERTLEWLGRVVVPGVFDGRHRFDLEPVDGGSATRFRQSERFTGLLVVFLRTMLNEATLPGFVAMNEQLKVRAEATVEQA